MPRYYFNVHDNLGLIDDEGVELPDLDVAVREAVRMAGSLLKDSGHQMPLGSTWSLEVADDSNPAIFRIDVQVRPTSAMLASEPQRSAA